MMKMNNSLLKMKFDSEAIFFLNVEIKHKHDYNN